MRPLGGPRALRRDPAPTRLAYRLHRLWLTPFFRAMLRVGIPVFCLVFAGAWYVGDDARRSALVDRYYELRRSIEQRPEFMVGMMRIEGASPEVVQDIQEILAIDFPVSSFELDLEYMRGMVVGLDAVEKAELRIAPGGILRIDVAERQPAVIWRGRDGLEMLDAQGHRVSALESRTDRPDLPLIAGEGAQDRVPEALDLLAAAGPIAGRVRGLVRVGERRWDLVLDRDQRILLPETGALRALERVIALDQAEDMLARDIVTVDMRNGERPTLRLAPGATVQRQQATTTEAGVTEG